MELIDELVTEVDVAKKLRVSLACLRRWRLERRGPPFLKVGTLVRYRVDELSIGSNLFLLVDRRMSNGTRG